MRTYQYSRLSRDTFEKEWRTRFKTLFQRSGEEGEACWIPDQVFAGVMEITLYHPQPYYLRRDYRDFEKALRHLGENEFVVLDKEALTGESKHVGIVFHLEEHSGCAKDSGQYHIEGQPLDFYMLGRRLDWGFVSSEPYNIGILNAEGAVLEPFIAESPGSDEEKIREYFEHTPASYQRRFEHNYLGH